MAVVWQSADEQNAIQDLAVQSSMTSALGQTQVFLPGEQTTLLIQTITSPGMNEQ